MKRNWKRALSLGSKTCRAEAMHAPSLWNHHSAHLGEKLMRTRGNSSSRHHTLCRKHLQQAPGNLTPHSGGSQTLLSSLIMHFHKRTGKNHFCTLLLLIYYGMNASHHLNSKQSLSRITNNNPHVLGLPTTQLPAAAHQGGVPFPIVNTITNIPVNAPLHTFWFFTRMNIWSYV